MTSTSPKARPAAQQNADINVTPFVDIMLVLLIIFMVSAPLATVALRLDLPPTDAYTRSLNPDPVYVTVNADGSIFVRDTRSSLDTLSTDVCAALGGGDCRQGRVFVRGQAETSYSRFMGVMNDLQSNGFFKVGLMSEDID